LTFPDDLRILGTAVTLDFAPELIFLFVDNKPLNKTEDEVRLLVRQAKQPIDKSNLAAATYIFMNSRIDAK